jgi:hypothetical protein
MVPKTTSQAFQHAAPFGLRLSARRFAPCQHFSFLYFADMLTSEGEA